MKKKEKIMEAATQLFNEKGYGTVNLKELAQTIGISRGNLTYHFKNKEALLEAIIKNMWERISQEKKKTRQMPSFENMHNQTQLYYSFQKKYAFVFLDTNVRNHPSVKEQFKAMIERTIEDFRKMIAFGIQLGTIKEETIPGTYHSLSFSVWMLSFYWLSQQTTRDDNMETDAEKIIWGLILPHMTEKGITAFKQFFGDDFSKQLEKPFNVSQHAFIKF